MAEAVLEKRVNVQFPLVTALPQLDPKSVEYSDQVAIERLTDEDLRSVYIATKDFPQYEVIEGEPVLEISRLNPGFENVNDFCKQIRETGNYQVSKRDAQRIRRSKTTITAPLLELELIKDDSEWGHININTSKDGSQFNKYQKSLIERVFGNMEKSTIGIKECDFNEYMNLLKSKGISTTRFYALNPEYVLEHAKKGPVARVSRLISFNYDSGFLAVDRYVDNDNFCLRGVPVGAGGASAKILAPKYGQIICAAKELVPNFAMKEFKRRIKNLYK